MKEKGQKQPVLSLEQLDMMKHALGFRGAAYRSVEYESYRNYFTTPVREPCWEELCQEGLAERSNLPKGFGIGPCPSVYRVTRKGAEILSQYLGIKIDLPSESGGRQ